ncbi:MAG: hypothetical protein K1X61_02675 [Chitinophagales bacterium]|nr:hypothetical protein [Chitinophagales bacterium]
MSAISNRINPRKWIVFGFFITFPSVIFWCFVIYGRISHDYALLNTLLNSGGDFCDLLLKGLFPAFSLMIAYICNRAIQRRAITQNVWHQETNLMRLNRILINWNALLLLVMIFSYFNN